MSRSCQNKVHIAMLNVCVYIHTYIKAYTPMLEYSLIPSLSFGAHHYSILTLEHVNMFYRYSTNSKAIFPGNDLLEA